MTGHTRASGKNSFLRNDFVIPREEFWSFRHDSLRSSWLQSRILREKKTGVIRYAHYSGFFFSLTIGTRSFSSEWNEEYIRVGLYSIFYFYCTIPHARVKARAHVYTYVRKIKLPLAHNNLAHPEKKKKTILFPTLLRRVGWLEKRPFTLGRGILTGVVTKLKEKVTTR